MHQMPNDQYWIWVSQTDHEQLDLSLDDWLLSWIELVINYKNV